MGVGAEDANDLALKIALGPKNGDISKDVAKATIDAVNKARNETQKAVDDEITKALAKGVDGGKAAWEASIDKYKAQEASMGHKGWAQSWARPERAAGLKSNWRRAPADAQQLAAVHH
mmetsp:Transcript_78341/g.210771  ORF Transcript_78341/g.210771 Transcript_78341/m.210771 type:complete len:118 (-) Transcript_78341:47-400(-)